jgi:hypothetical protein
MFDFIPELGELVWIILPLLFLQIFLLAIGLWEWNKKKENIGQNKVIWLLLILLINFFGPIIFLVYSQKLNPLGYANKAEIDDWGG